MPYTDQQIETLKSTDPNIVKEALGRMNESQRTELMTAVQDYNNRKSGAPKLAASHAQAEPAPAAAQPQAPKPGIVERLAYSTPVQAVTDLPYAAGQLLVSGPDRIAGIPNGILEAVAPGSRAKIREYLQNQINQREARYRALPENQNVLGDINRGIINYTTASALAPGVAQPGTSIMAQGAAGAMTQPVVGNAEDVTGGKLEQGTIGALTAKLLQIGGKGAAWVGGKAADVVSDALAGTKLGERLGLGSRLNPKYAGAPELSAELDKAGIKHTVGDITSDPKVLSQEAAMARRDPRMMDLRVRQNQQALQHAERVVSDLKTAVEQEGWKGTDDLKAAVEAGGKRAKQAQALLTAVENSGDDWKLIAKNSGNLKLMVNKLRADALYDKAEKIADLYGPVKADKFIGSIKANIRAIEGNQANDQSLVPYLKGILADAEAGKNLTFAELRNTRSILNRKISSLYNPNATVQDADAGRKALENVVGSMEQDLDKYANSHSSGLRNAWKQATEFYKNAVVPYKDKELGKILVDQDPMALGRMFDGKDAYTQKRLFDLLGTKGQAAIRWGLLDDAIAAGEKTQRGAMAPTFSAAKAASKVESLMNRGTYDVAFKGTDNWAAKGLARILRTVDKSDTIAWIPPTGEVTDRIGAAAKGDLTTLGAVQKAADWLNRERLFQLYTDPKGKALLVRASAMKPGSKELQALVSKELPKVLGVTAGDAAAKPANLVPFTSAAPIPAVAQDSQQYPPMASLQ